MKSRNETLTPFSVSFFRHLADPLPIQMNVSRFLNAIKRGQFQKNIREIRQEKNKKKRNKLKGRLPAICVSATFKNVRSLKNVNTISGLISIDIDNCLKPKHLSRIIAQDKYTFSVFISPSGNGLKVIIKADYTRETYTATFLAIEKYYLNKYKIQIDKSCKDITRLMFISSDPNLFYNKHSTLFTEKFFPKPKPKPFFPKITNSINLTEKLIARIEETRIDITGNYHDWLRIAFALISEFGINGLAYFHRISQFYADYDRAETQSQFFKCYKTGTRSITIKTLYSIAKDYGITFK